MAEASARLLIVDDDPELLKFLIEELSSAGHHCTGCDNGQDALLYLRQKEFQLVVLDWTLPDFSGLEVCRRLRSSSYERCIPPILVDCHLLMGAYPEKSAPGLST